MNTIDSTRLAELTISMLERTAMVLAEIAALGEEHPPPTRFARIAYRGPSRGTVVLGATDGFLRELAASLLGVDTVDVNVDVEGNDALKEMANIGGSVILALSGDRCDYSLGLPELVRAADVPGLEARARAECTVATEGATLRVYWDDRCAAGVA